MAVLIYCPYRTNRLVYTLNIIFQTLLGTTYRIVHEIPVGKNEPIIAYGNIASSNSYSIPESGLLYATDIQTNLPKIQGRGIEAELFPEMNHNHPFDIFSAVFYLITRYEEYQPYQPDLYQRFPHKKSIAFDREFLHLPLINIWVKELGKRLCKQFPLLKLSPPYFSFQPTYDIDIAWSYKHKGLKRNLGGFVRKPTSSRLLTLAGLKKDPFDVYDELQLLHKTFRLNPIYFWITATKNSRYDKHILPSEHALQKLIQKHKSATNGLHPSWQTHNDGALLRREKETLEVILNTPVVLSRQHYLRFTLPDTYLQLIKTGITDDYSMMYGSINGFRASIANAYPWFNLITNEETDLIIHPPCFMDANSFYEQEQDIKRSSEELNHYYHVCKNNHGALITIFHNNFLGTDSTFKGWREMYEAFIHLHHREAAQSSYAS